MSDPVQDAEMVVLYRYEPLRVFEPGQVVQRSFEECYEERPRRLGESIKDWLDAIHRAMLEPPIGLGMKPPRRRQIGLISMPVFDDGDGVLGEWDFLKHEKELFP